MKHRIFNSIAPGIDARFQIRNAASADAPVEILVYEPIGKDPWTGEGMDAKAFLAELGKIDAGRNLDVRINSRGGDVFDGLAIYRKR